VRNRTEAFAVVDAFGLLPDTPAASTVPGRDYYAWAVAAAIRERRQAVLS
jgi:hypothetical protein